jgi:deoxyribonuclease V
VKRLRTALHHWDVSPREASLIQKKLAPRVERDRPVRKVRLVAGADVSYDRFSDVIYAAVVVVRLPDLAVVERRGAVRETKFPYVPGFLSFREAPSILDAWELLESRPDVLMLDGQGIAHPRRMGVACHVGLWLDLPTIGCAKSRLIGQYEAPAKEPGSRTPLEDRGEIVGAVLRTKHAVAPLFVSPGHRIDTESAVRVVLSCCAGYRLPEPTRQAHLHANELRRTGRAPEKQSA